MHSNPAQLNNVGTSTYTPKLGSPERIYHNKSMIKISRSSVSSNVEVVPAPINSIFRLLQGYNIPKYDSRVLKFEQCLKELNDS
jgi:hypothetical protein